MDRFNVFYVYKHFVLCIHLEWLNCFFLSSFTSSFFSIVISIKLNSFVHFIHIQVFPIPHAPCLIPSIQISITFRLWLNRLLSIESQTIIKTKWKKKSPRIEINAWKYSIWWAHQSGTAFIIEDWTIVVSSYWCWYCCHLLTKNAPNWIVFWLTSAIELTGKSYKAIIFCVQDYERFVFISGIRRPVNCEHCALFCFFFSLSQIVF